MPECAVTADTAHAHWATRRRRRGNAPRVVAALLLHLLALTALVIGTDHLRLARRGGERTTTLVQVTLDPRRPPGVPTVRPLPKPIASTAPAPGARATPTAVVRAPGRPERGPRSDPLSLPIRAPDFAAPTVATAAKPPASAASAPLVDILDTAATRAAIRDAARATRLSERANAATHEDADSEMVAVDGSRCEGCTRNLAPSRQASRRLSQGIAGASRPDCLKLSAAAGLLALPALAYGEATGKCGN